MERHKEKDVVDSLEKFTIDVFTPAVSSEINQKPTEADGCHPHEPMKIQCDL